MLNKITLMFGFAFFLILLLCQPAFAAQNGTIKGIVKDAQSKEVLPYANIVLLGTSLGDAADAKGNYTINNVPPGKYTLRASYLGYKNVDAKIQVTDGGAKITQDFSLAPEGGLVNEVVVTAQAKGQYEAINEQLNSIAIKNVVSLAKIQELPDANAAESVSRLPGVSLIRTGGEGSKVVVRGLSPQYNRVTIDGVELPANVTSSDPGDHKSEMSSSDELRVSGDRATDLSMISSNMLGGIEVIKAITPDMDATVFGGVINFSMRKAQKSEYGIPQFELLSQGSYNNLKESYKDYKLNASYEQRFFDNSFGVFLQGSAEKKNLSSNQLNASYNFSGLLQATDEGNPEFQNMSLTDALRDRKRYGGTVVLDFVHETGSIGFMNFYSRSKTNTISRAEKYSLLDNDLFYELNNSDQTLDVYSNLLNIKQNYAGFDIEARLSHSYSETENPGDVNFEFWQNDAGFNNKYSSLKYKDTKEIASNVIHDPANAAFFTIYNNNSTSKDRTYNAGIDFSTDLTFSDLVSSKVKFGVAYQYRERSYDYNQSSGSVFYDDGGQVNAAILRAFPQFGTSVTAAGFIDDSYSYGTFLKGDYKLGSPLSSSLMLKVLEVAKQNPGTGNGGGYKVAKLASVQDDYSGNEGRTAGYLMTTVNVGQQFMILPGVRYQNLTSTYEGVRGESIPGGFNHETIEKTVSHGYWLPMVHFRYKPIDWFQFHFAYTNTLNYPDYNAIIPKYFIGQNWIVFNNYNLKPAQSENFDAMISVYANEIGLFSFGGFKKNITDLIFATKSYPKDFTAYPELQEKLKNRSESFTLFTYINNPFKIDVYGIETEWQTHFWYLPEPFNNIVFNINYTHVFSEAKYPKTTLISYLDTVDYIQKTTSVDTFYNSRLLNQPNDIINISFGYDYAGFSMRASMLYQDNIFKRPDFWFQNRQQSDKYVRFDLSVKQELPWYNIQVYFNLNNISGADDIDINQKTSFVTSEQRYSMTADFGVRVKL